MSTANHRHSTVGHAAHHDGHEDEELHVSTREYVTGFVLSVILTAIPFAMVMGKWVQKAAAAAYWILGLGAIQIVVHMVYFLHMNRKAQGGWTLMALMFTVLMVIITLAGSLWVMFHLDANLMPEGAHDVRIRP
ncbi:MAG: cytochrome o ubiquinol oxidase subunit IV [Lautropia sp.]|nr:cytochrome o ubiquinol oxidase subunit IV [Lautropia sp.]